MPTEAFHGRAGGTVFVDRLMPCRQSRQWRWSEACHLFTLPGWLEDLHEFAQALNLRRAWFQDHATLPHYDLTARRRSMAIARGAVEVSREETVEAIRSWRRSRQATAAEAIRMQMQADGSETRNLSRDEARQRFLTPAEVSEEFARGRALLRGGQL